MEKNKTTHKVFFQTSQNMNCLEDNSVNLIVTSPPYPMIDMWDDIMTQQNKDMASAFKEKDGERIFELMQQELDKTWKECYRVLDNGGFLCINIGDATRTINGIFKLYNNHSRITSYCTNIGFNNLPNIIWRKQTNVPNKFMGSGMLPCGAYVTLEHEWILIFRKGGKRIYKDKAQKQERRYSSFFWEERNSWFSDLWEIKGAKQRIINSPTRNTSASFPLTIPYRLINMYSQVGDTILDPFLGLGTTSIAAIVSQRNSIGFEIDSLLKDSITSIFDSINIDELNKFICERYRNHLQFVAKRQSEDKEVKHYNKFLSCNVMTSQETDLKFNYIMDVRLSKEYPLNYICTYGELANKEYRLQNSKKI